MNVPNAVEPGQQWEWGPGGNLRRTLRWTVESADDNEIRIVNGKRLKIIRRAEFLRNYRLATHRCKCGYPIAFWERICGECACEDDCAP